VKGETARTPIIDRNANAIVREMIAGNKRLEIPGYVTLHLSSSRVATMSSRMPRRGMFQEGNSLRRLSPRLTRISPCAWNAFCAVSSTDRRARREFMRLARKLAKFLNYGAGTSRSDARNEM